MRVCAQEGRGRTHNPPSLHPKEPTGQDVIGVTLHVGPCCGGDYRDTADQFVGIFSTVHAATAAVRKRIFLKDEGHGDNSSREFLEANHTGKSAEVACGACCAADEAACACDEDGFCEKCQSGIGVLGDCRCGVVARDIDAWLNGLPGAEAAFDAKCLKSIGGVVDLDASGSGTIQAAGGCCGQEVYSLHACKMG